MANVLEKIVADKREEVAARKEALPLESFKANLVPSEKSLFAALSEPNAGFIFECKKASPSKGLIREHFDLDEILAAYTPYAAGISVLTDEKYFQGKFEYLAYVTERVAQPVLNKDFFVDTYQVYLARHYNADAVLLMLSVLNDDEYRELASVANELSLDILTEVSNEEEMERAIALEANIIGINNRNLRDLSTDLATTERLVPMLEKATHDYVVISESGIYTHQDVLRLAPISQGFLVGSALMAEADLPRAVKTLVNGAVKVCGLTSSEQAQMAFDKGASFGGLIFAEKSPRCVSEAQALNITQSVNGAFVGVFVNHDVDDVASLATSLNLFAVQLHGSEDETYISALADKLPEGCEIWNVEGVKAASSDALPETVDRHLNNSLISRVLLDCQVGNAKGGTGEAFDWQLLNDIEAKHKLVLAGGINAQNVADAIATGSGAIDVNSGVETAPGEKCEERLDALFAICRRY
ncbi:bifunctional indole-3-glycerol-phosphate synthase TrpC/phosphoribosylanthranilate isomerase TrpF [Alteromonas sp. BL110]|uniref:bifunctional indole-3-glycerol-phosphate synthase TrpC/phosphoribosylanthranilate isomerase TrpF n=1 Tax=Alteromonas sp. BL110 TaxID=1714845 RepID=UPI000E551A26|nr:bifunctional indole-3-glycerol-phosphate synthase TrpC/phosphoribosylanthranilate isomerase TrpF [Alteromonas sp. BL110]AXT37379.1 bifunctional indole-3-glycerol-phosphate synthase TrpC/phosphoribosylanthranilate isomerase TrpF [Alteromonas sp. BL110]RKM80116.1 bifunctional indole-3-glycerol-phosphate synthase TrpC/phosphoribosylanthranilate isomerase TrpF [Alteromonas sp. BL110]